MSTHNEYAVSNSHLVDGVAADGLRPTWYQKLLDKHLVRHLDVILFEILQKL